MAFNVGGILGGGLTPVVAQMLADSGGLTLVGGYLSVACGLSLVALVAIRR
jgi:fucose permease